MSDTIHTVQSLINLSAEQTLKPEVQHVGTIRAMIGDAEMRECLMLDADEELPDDDEYLVRLSMPGYSDCTDWEHMETLDAVCEWLREDFYSGADSDDMNQRTWFERNDIDFELYQQEGAHCWQDLPEWLTDVHITALADPRYLGSLYNSDGTEITRYHDRERFDHLAARMRRVIDDSDSDDWQCRLVDPGFITAGPKVGRVDDGYMIVGSQAVIAEVEITDANGEGLGVHILKDYAYLEVGVRID